MSAGSKRDRDGNTRGKTTPDAPRGRFHGMFEQFRDELDEHYDRRERIVKASRDVTAHSKKIIFALQRVKTLNQEFPPHTQKDMDTRMAEITELLRSIAPDLQSINRHRYTWPLRCLEELVEALSFAHYLRHQTLITLAEAQAAMPADIALTPHDYMYGVFDLFGELMRFATVQRGEVIAAPDQKGKRTILRDIQALGCAFEMLPEVPGKEFRGKMEGERAAERVGAGYEGRGAGAGGAGVDDAGLILVAVGLSDGAWEKWPAKLGNSAIRGFWVMTRYSRTTAARCLSMQDQKAIPPIAYISASADSDGILFSLRETAPGEQLPVARGNRNKLATESAHQQVLGQLSGLSTLNPPPSATVQVTRLELRIARLLERRVEAVSRFPSGAFRACPPSSSSLASVELRWPTVLAASPVVEAPELVSPRFGVAFLAMQPALEAAMATMADGTDVEVDGGEHHQPPAAHDTSATGADTAMMLAYPHVVDGGMALLQPQQQAFSLGLAVQPRAHPLHSAYSGPIYQPQAGAVCTRSTFFVETNPGRRLSGQMYVECLEPLIVVQPLPIILIHGDFHTGQIWSTKPDGNPGWASFFCYHGQRVYVVDLPPFGRSNINCRPSDRARMSKAMVTLDEGTVERELTAPGKQDSECWAGARNHSQWPGVSAQVSPLPTDRGEAKTSQTGQRGDPVFKTYCASLVPLRFKKAERQAVAQDALARLLERTGRAVLIGEGSGATMAWLAADLRPGLVAAVVAIEPAGPPAGTAVHTGEDGARRHSSHIKFAPGVRPYGLAEIPLTYDPPLEMSSGHCEPALDLVTALWQSGQGSCILQRSGDMVFPVESEGDPCAGHAPAPEPRKLVNLRKMRHAIVTAHASSHSTYDWATSQFLRQAGVRAFTISLENYDIFGNGHLMFLETNSDEIASLIGVWIGLNAKFESEQLSYGCTVAFAEADGLDMT
ncbi:Uncharacterized protein TCAP_00241 [Tolypocladium capitatum]|uniref:Uncharacterized protein n=1 Tax=Tolypocladium capitatum TaxID=45235 RepID=A0A2K3QQM8_9HYPO|nr:Uncharacterized protein TCAP_00241 [Tolypocladium capitatum]